MDDPSRRACRPATADSIEEMCSSHAPMTANARFPDGTIFGDWRLTAFIGRGGNGEVYCAEHITLGTPAAVKVLMRDEERAKARFEREARLLARLKSEAFPHFYAYGEANGTAYLAMELLEPGDLPTGDKAIARFLLKVCDAVAELHALGLVHRDIKPGNILWRTVGSRVPRDRGLASLPCREPVLADLGLVKDISTSDGGLPASDVTIGGVGTPGYGAPEQLERGEATVTSDIHALGVLTDCCFGGKPSRAWVRIIQRATSSIPAHRYPSIAAFVRAVRRRNLMRKMLPVLAFVSVILGIIVGGIAFPPHAAVSTPPPSVEPNEYAIPQWEELTNETIGFYQRAMALKVKLDEYDDTGAKTGIVRKEFMAQVEKERGELLKQWEATKKLQDKKIFEWKEMIRKSKTLAQNPVAYAVATKLPDDIQAWQNKIDGLLRDTIYFRCMQQ